MADNTPSDMGTAIKDARERTGLSQAEIARRLGVRQQSVSRWESGDALPRLAYAQKLAQLLTFTDGEVRLLLGMAADEDADDDIEVDYNSAIARMPDHVRKAVIELARPYLEDD